MRVDVGTCRCETGTPQSLGRSTVPSTRSNLSGPCENKSSTSLSVSPLSWPALQDSEQTVLYKARIRTLETLLKHVPEKSRSMGPELLRSLRKSNSPTKPRLSMIEAPRHFHPTNSGCSALNKNLNRNCLVGRCRVNGNSLVRVRVGTACKITKLGNLSNDKMLSFSRFLFFTKERVFTENANAPQQLPHRTG